jgi:hypothetical protein
MKTKVSKAVKTLTEALRKDPDFYRSYQANIAMAFKDEYDRSSKKYKNRGDIYKIANTAADNFMNLWIEKK